MFLAFSLTHTRARHVTVCPGQRPPPAWSQFCSFIRRDLIKDVHAAVSHSAHQIDRSVVNIVHSRRKAYAWPYMKKDPSATRAR